MEALTTWAPHIVYVEGGNTFWLQHCLEKGNWDEPLRKACVGPDAASLYIGKSAGAIIAGTTVETATWKVGATCYKTTYCLELESAKQLAIGLGRSIGGGRQRNVRRLERSCRIGNGGFPVVLSAHEQ